MTKTFIWMKKIIWTICKCYTPEEASSRSSLLISQSRDPEKCAQFTRFPRIRATENRESTVLQHKANKPCSWCETAEFKQTLLAFYGSFKTFNQNAYKFNTIEDIKAEKCLQIICVVAICGQIYVNSHLAAHTKDLIWIPILLSSHSELFQESGKHCYIGVDGLYNPEPNLSHPEKKNRGEDCLWNRSLHITCSTNLSIHTYCIDLPLLETCSADSLVLSCCSVSLHGLTHPVLVGNTLLNLGDYTSTSPLAYCQKTSFLVH